MKKYLAIILISVGLFSTQTAIVNAASTSTTTHSTTNTAVEATNTEATASEAKADTEEHKTEEDTGVVGMFGLNWKLFLAQLINFGIVLFVLWKWVFKPVTKGLSDRTDKIEGSLAEAEKIMKDRADFDSWKNDEIGKVRSESSAIIAEAKKSAEELKADTLQTTTDEQNRLIEQTKARLESEKILMIQQAKTELADIVVEATSKILKEKIDPAKDKQLIDDALKSAQS